MRLILFFLAKVSEVGEHEDASKGPGVVNPQPSALAPKPSLNPEP